MDECIHAWATHIAEDGEPYETCVFCGDPYHGVIGAGYESVPPVS